MGRFGGFDPYLKEKEAALKARAEESKYRLSRLKELAFCDGDARRKSVVYVNQKARSKVAITLAKVNLKSKSKKVSPK